MSGSNTYIILHDDKTEWTFIDEHDDYRDGILEGEWLCSDGQLDKAKSFLVKLIGYEIKSSELRVDNQRSDRHDW